MGATEVDFVNDSELIASPAGRACTRSRTPRPDAAHKEALAQPGEFERWSVRSVPREKLDDADALVNQALDAAG